MANVVIVGTQWGDEGKGKVVDILAEFAEVVVRFQGGSNAGHTLVINGEKIVTHLVPSGVMHPGKKCVIGPAVVIDPEVLVGEIEWLRKRGLAIEPSNLLISDRAHVVMPYHKSLDSARESAKGAAKLGTTQRGIGPCLEDKVGRVGIRMSDFLDLERLRDRLSKRLPELNALLGYYGRETIRSEDLLSVCNSQAALLKPFVCDVGAFVRGEMDRSRNLLFEGAQGTLLDIDHGTYPFVTGSNTVAGAAATALGFGPQRIGPVVGVCKAYSTRVGEGPFPTELTDERGREIQTKGAEFGATTGRPRRCGWLDMVAVRYALALNGCTSLCITKLDVLGGMDCLKIAVGYKLDGKEIVNPPANLADWQRVEPILVEVEGWKEDIRDVREQEGLPLATRKFLSQIEHSLRLPIDIISVGPGRGETIFLKNPFRNFS